MSILYRRTLTIAECLDRFGTDEAKRQYQQAIERLNRTTDREMNGLQPLPSSLSPPV